MTNEKLTRLKEVLKIQSKSKQEHRMIAYLESVLTEKGYDHYTDDWGNVYVTKGETEYYPCFVAHTDTVHRINDNMIVVETKEGGNTILTGMDSVTGQPSGIGGDDKCGVFLALEMLDTFDNVKAALFVSEEIGCIGSRQADPLFFEDVAYAIQYDSPEGDSLSYTLMGEMLFNEDSEFGKVAGNLILEHGIDKWERHPYTDVWPLMDKFDFQVLNLAAGYYRYHTPSEYVIVEDVQNSYELGVKIVNSLGENKHTRKKSKKSSYWGGYSEPKLLTEYKEKQRKELLGDLDFDKGDDVFENSNITYLDDESVNESIQSCYWWGNDDDIDYSY
jgi:di/tripeptidase